MARKILTVGLELASDDVTHEEFESKVSLLDWDIVLFKPQITEFISYADQYKGKPSLNDRQSFQLKEACEHWRREIRQAVDSGKTVIVFLPPIEEVYIDTGERQYSGTGRNRATTRIVDLYSNYNCIPAALEPTNSRGSAVKLAPKGAEVLASYWADFGAHSEYQVLLSDKTGLACFLTKNGDKAVGALFRSKSSNGSLVCVPDIDFYHETFFEEDEQAEDGSEVGWTAEATQFAARLIGSIVALDAALRSEGEVTPEPSWAKNPSFSLPAEEQLRAHLLEAEAQLEQAQRRKESLVEELSLAGQLRSLLYEKGKPLENAIIDALKLLGFNAEPFKEGGSEFDVVFESTEGRLIGEAEGKDSKAVNVDKLRQLTMNIHEDLQRDEVTVPAKGVLFGNGFRLSPPGDRSAPFTEKCMLAAKSSNIALVATHDLFRVAKYLSGEKNQVFAAECRKLLLDGIGLIELPPVPEELEPDVSGAEK
jgi:hypothetical protein